MARSRDQDDVPTQGFNVLAPFTRLRENWRDWMDDDAEAFPVFIIATVLVAIGVIVMVLLLNLMANHPLKGA
jgi:hypothetical protein